MVFHAVREYRIRNIFINRPVVQSREKRYKLQKKKKGIHLVRKNNVKTKRLRMY